MRGHALALALAALAGCDSVFGLTYKPQPCKVPGFDGAPATTIAMSPHPPGGSVAFSVSWDETLAILDFDGQRYEMTLPGGTPMPIDLGIYPAARYSLSPEGDALLYSAAEEPPILQSAQRTGAASWSVAGPVPAGVYAGTPSAAEFGPTRVLVRLRDAHPDVQEYELDGARWVAVDSTHPVDGVFAPNLTPDGLTMSYDDGAGTTLAATRTSTAEWFGTPAPTSSGGNSQPQLLDDCHRLYVVANGGAVVRFDR